MSPLNKYIVQAEFTAGTVKSEEKELKTYYSCGSDESKAKITLLKGEDDLFIKIKQ